MIEYPAPGKYVGTVIRHSYGTSAQKGTPKFDVAFQVEHGDDLVEMNFECWLTDKAMGMARKSLKAIGYDPDTMDLDMLANDTAKLMGNKATVTIVEEEYNDEYRRKIGFVDPISAPPKPGQLAALTQALKDVKGSTKKKPVSAAVQKETQKIAKHFSKPATAEVKAEGDDIPF